ncbi:hypothetical protein OG242_09965 [Streptomyces sp. NBC_00727]
MAVSMDTLIEGVAPTPHPKDGGVPHGPRGFCFERPGQLKEY